MLDLILSMTDIWQYKHPQSHFSPIMYVSQLKSKKTQKQFKRKEVKNYPSF